jgi:hypothetical protein
MAPPNFIVQAKELFAQGKTEACIDLLLTHIEHRKLYYEVLDLKRRINALQNREARGLINQEDATLEHNQISNAILLILQKVDTRPAEEQEATPAPPPQGALVRPASRTNLFILLAVLGVLLAGLLIWQFSKTSEPQQAQVEAAEPEGKAGTDAAEPGGSRTDRQSPEPPAPDSRVEDSGARADEAAFKEARQTNTLRAYYEYLKAFPDGRFVEEAKKRIAEMEGTEKDRKAFEAAQRRNTADAYAAYLKAFPNGTYAAQARKRLEMIRQEEAESQRAESGLCKGCARVRSFNVSHQTDKMMVIDVRYYYDGSRGEPAFVSAVMANDGKASSYYAHNPGRVYRGNKVTRCTLKVADSAPATFTSNQIRFSFYGGEDRKTFHREFKPYKKTWKK